MEICLWPKQGCMTLGSCKTVMKKWICSYLCWGVMLWAEKLLTIKLLESSLVLFYKISLSVFPNQGSTVHVTGWSHDWSNRCNTTDTPQSLLHVAYKTENPFSFCQARDKREPLLLAPEFPIVHAQSLHTSQVAHQAGAYPGFCSRKRLGIFLLPPGWDASPSQGYPSIKFAGTHLYTWVERGTVRVKCLA